MNMSAHAALRSPTSQEIISLEFASNAVRYSYPEQVKSRTHSAIDELISMIETHQFPFS